MENIQVSNQVREINLSIATGSPQNSLIHDSPLVDYRKNEWKNQ